MKSVSEIRLGPRRRNILIGVIVLVTVVLSVMTFPPAPAVIAAIGLGLVAGGLTAAFPTELDWLRYVVAFAVAYGARFVAAAWNASEGWQTVAVIFVALCACLVSGVVFGRARIRFSA